jgi:hypothetical protein
MADITLDAFVDGGGSFYTHTCAGNNRILFLVTRGDTVPFVNGVRAAFLKSMSFAADPSISSFGFINLYVVQNPLLGANAVTFPLGSVVCISASYKHPNQPIGLFELATAQSANAATTFTSSITSSVNKCLAVFAQAAYAFGGAPTAGANLTYRGSYSTSVNVPSIFDSNTVISPAGLFSGTTNTGGSGAAIYHIMQLIGPNPGNKVVGPIGSAFVIPGNTIFAMPARAINIEYSTTGAAILEASLDNGDNFVTIDTAPGAGLRTVAGVVASCIRPSADITVVFRKTKSRF